MDDLQDNTHSLQGFDRALEEELEYEQAQRKIRPLGLSVCRAQAEERHYKDRKLLFKFRPEAPVQEDYGFPEAPSDEPQTPAEAKISERELAQRIIREAFREPDLTLDDLRPYRVHAAWRIVRRMAMLKGLTGFEETLDESLSPDHALAEPLDLWLHPLTVDPTAYRVTGGERPTVAFVEFHRRAEMLDDQYRYAKFNVRTNTIEALPGIPLTPPPVPKRWITETLDIADDYDPHKDVLLRIYIDLISYVADQLRIPPGAPTNHNMGRYGLAGLLDPRTIRVAFPSKLQIAAWEEMLVQETLSILIRQGVQRTREILHRKYGLLSSESRSLLGLARKQGTILTEAEIEDDRAIMILRLEDLIRRSQDALDLRAELGALKQLAIVQGLSQAEANDFMNNFIEVARTTSALKDGQGSLPTETPATRLLQQYSDSES